MVLEKLISVVLFGQGFVTGIMLTVMLGPVTMIIIRNGLQVNRTAGVLAATGTWVSDFLFIGLTYWLTTSIDQWTQRPDMRLALFLTGGMGLLLMGLLMLRVKQKKVDDTTIISPSKYTNAFAGGFLVNSLSPFTLFFWLGVAVFLHLQVENPLWYYAGVMMSLAIGDFTKAWLAPKLTLWLKEKNVYWIQIVAGIFIAGTGLYVIILGILE
jgi:threonine/homoserine/homoserine lactone efflux protein